MAKIVLQYRSQDCGAEVGQRQAAHRGDRGLLYVTKVLFIETPTFILVKWIQCDQISRNDATLAKILKDFGNFGAFDLYLPNYFGKFIGQIVIDVNVTG